MIVTGAYITADLVHKEKLAELEEQKLLKVGEEVIHLKTYRIDKIFFMNIPDAFVSLDEETLKSTYPFTERPELVFQSPDNMTHIFITTTNTDMTDDNLAAYVENIKTTFTTLMVKTYDTYQSYEKLFVKLIGIDTTTNLYRNIRYFTLDNKLVIIEFNTNSAQADEWKRAAEVILDSICFDEKDIKNENS